MKLYTRTYYSDIQLKQDLETYFIINYGQDLKVDISDSVVETGIDPDIRISSIMRITRLIISIQSETTLNIFKFAPVYAGLSEQVNTMKKRAIELSKLKYSDQETLTVRNKMIATNAKYVSFCNEQSCELQLEAHDVYGEKVLKWLHEPHEKLLKLIEMNKVLER